MRMKKFITIIGMVIVFSTSCFAQVKNLVAAIEDKQTMVIPLSTDQLKVQQRDKDSFWTESHVMCENLKDSILTNLAKDGYKARLGFILAAVKYDCPLVIKSENQDAFSVTAPNGDSYVVLIERVKKSQKLLIEMYCYLEQDWQLTFKDVYGYDYFSQKNN
jgi:hypothetical protein